MTQEEITRATIIGAQLVTCNPDRMDAAEAFQMIAQGQELARIVLKWIKDGEMSPGKAP